LMLYEQGLAIADHFIAIFFCDLVLSAILKQTLNQFYSFSCLIIIYYVTSEKAFSEQMGRPSDTILKKNRTPQSLTKLKTLTTLTKLTKN
jgi:DNA integrity scanning protein DisA with diadenylate cyclase activity